MANCLKWLLKMTKIGNVPLVYSVEHGLHLMPFLILFNSCKVLITMPFISLSFLDFDAKTLDHFHSNSPS